MCRAVMHKIYTILGRSHLAEKKSPTYSLLVGSRHLDASTRIVLTEAMKTAQLENTSTREPLLLDNNKIIEIPKLELTRRKGMGFHWVSETSERSH